MGHSVSILISLEPLDVLHEFSGQFQFVFMAETESGKSYHNFLIIMKCSLCLTLISEEVAFTFS